MEIFVSAGESSSDIHCAELISELKKLTGPSTSFFGLGGDRLKEQGVALMMHNREFSVAGGLFEVIGKLPRRRKLELALEKRLFDRTKPKLGGAILVDNGEINLRLASLLNFFGVPVVYYIPPKIWVWRFSRIEAIAQHVKLVLSILPFEEPLYKAWEIPFQYIGNPLLDEVPQKLDASSAKSALGIDAHRDVIAVLPGSRYSEIKFHVPIFSKALALFLEQGAFKEKPVVVIPTAQNIDPAFLEVEFRKQLPGIDIKVFQGKSHECLKAARVALVKSGTSTLEAALLETPMVLAYQSSKTAKFVYRHIVRYRGFVGLVNLFHAKNAEAALGFEKREEPLVPELVLEDCTPEKISEALAVIYREGRPREEMLARLTRTRSLLRGRVEGKTISAAAAESTYRVFSENKHE